MNKLAIMLTMSLSLIFSNIGTLQAQTSDSEKLGKAIEYFQGSKYHEALILFQALDKEYKLNPRFKAYIGICYYYEWDYQNASKYLNDALPLLDSFSPHERSVYYFADAESHFNMEQYDKAIPLYENMLNLCYEQEKADPYYRLGFCYMFREDWHNARDYFQSALAYYKQFRNTPSEQARINQLDNMIKGIDKQLSNDKDH